MLKEIQINNFRTHRNTKLRFAKPITGIIGKSLRGKTNIIRSIKWVNDNRPSGFSFHSNFTKENEPTKVKIKTERETILASKTNKTHTYKLDDKIFRKVGKKVPEEISNSLNLSDINFQLQLDPPFLVTSTPGQVTKIISDITQTDKIEKAIIETRKRKSTIEAERKIISADIEKKQIRLDNLEVLDDIKIKVKKTKKLQNKINLLLEEQSYIENIFPKIKELKSKIKIGNSIGQISLKIKKAGKISYNIESLKEEKMTIIKIRSLKKGIKQIQREIEITKKRLSKLLKEKKKCPLCLAKFNSKRILKIIESV